MPTYQPRCSSPIRLAAGTRTSSKKTSLKWCRLAMLIKGRTVSPGVFLMSSIRRNEIPLCLGASGSVRTTSCGWISSAALTPTTTSPSQSSGQALAVALGDRVGAQGKRAHRLRDAAEIGDHGTDDDVARVRDLELESCKGRRGGVVRRPAVGGDNRLLDPDLPRRRGRRGRGREGEVVDRAGADQVDDDGRHVAKAAERETTAIAPSPTAGIGMTAGSPAPEPWRVTEPPLSTSSAMTDSGEIPPLPRPEKLNVNCGEQKQSSGSPASPSSE